MPDEPHAPLISLAKDLGRGEAEVLRGLLEAQGVPAILSQEAAGSVIPVDVGAFGQVELLVPADRESEARKVLEAYERPPGAAPSSREV